MTAAPQNDNTNDPWGSLEPYAQLLRSLLPRATAVALFDGRGELRWSSDSAVGPDLLNFVDDTLIAATSHPSEQGQLKVLGGDSPVYLCWLRSDDGMPFAVVAILCRTNRATDGEAPEFAFVHALVRPALECLRRDLLARATIDDLHRTVTALDKDLELLLADSEDGYADDSDELKSLLQRANDHLKCRMAALIAPDKGLVLMRASGPRAPDSQTVARTHRQLLSMAQMRREPLILNRLAPSPTLGVIPYRILCCPLRTATGRVAGIVTLFRDSADAPFVDRDARLADILTRKASAIIESSYDALSGLHTRHAFEQRVRAVVAARSNGAEWSALYVDSDQLHAINDNFGMHVGDSIIAQLGELVRRRLPPGAFAARISGDRFAVLLPIGIDDAALFAESLRDGAEQLSTLQGNSRVHVSVSIGVAPLNAQEGELIHSLAAAETACKAAKDRGRNRVEVYHTSDASIVRRFADINIAARLRAAISENRLRLDAQLMLPLGPQEHIRPHYELLLRMIDEDGQTVGPDRFLSAANRYQLMPMIDRWVIQQAIDQLKPHAALLVDRPAVFAINFSGQSLNDTEFDDFLLERLQGCGLDPGLFCFELTENATVANIKRAEVLMRRLRRLGCGVALDDFGTGLSSLSYLRQLPVTMLKIDGSFVRDILKDPRSESMVHAIAQLARSMTLATVAEYVETEEIRTRLCALGVDYAQGFAIGRPTPLVDVLAELPVLAAAAPAFRSASDWLSEPGDITLARA